MSDLSHDFSDPTDSVCGQTPPVPVPANIPEIDCETAALLRAWMRPLFQQAGSWTALMSTLDKKGYGLVIDHGRLVLREVETQRRVCTVRVLGTSLRELAARLGRPMVRPDRNRPACGEFLPAG